MDAGTRYENKVCFNFGYFGHSYFWRLFSALTGPTTYHTGRWYTLGNFGGNKMLTQQQIHAIAERLVEIVEDTDDELTWDCATETRVISYSTLKAYISTDVAFTSKVVTAAIEGDTNDAQDLCIEELRRVGVEQIAEAISDYEALPDGFKWEDYL